MKEYEESDGGRPQDSVSAIGTIDFTGDENAIPPAAQVPPAARRLNDKHRAELHLSGLSDATIQAAGIYSAADYEIEKNLGWHRGLPWGHAMVFPFPAVGGGESGYARVKLDAPRTNIERKKIKYETPRGKENRAYFPPQFFETFEAAAATVMTEGEKKALAGMQAGVPTIGLVGVWSWQQKRKRDDLGRGFGERHLIADLAAISWSNRKVIIVFDSDSATNRMVVLARDRLAEILTKAGAKVLIAEIPPAGDSKVGLDDYLVANAGDAPAALKKLLDSATPAETPTALGPMDWARQIIDDEYTVPLGRTLRWWRDEFWVWNGMNYGRISRNELRAKALIWLNQRLPEVTPRQASDVVECMSAVCLVPSNFEQANFLYGPSFDEPPSIVSFQNGLANAGSPFFDGQLREHTPAWFSPTVLSYPYDPYAKCPTWEWFLRDTLVDDNAIELLRRWFGLLLTADTSYQKILMMIGLPRSGKGTVNRVIKNVIGGDNCTSPTLSSLGSEFGLWPLVDKSVAILADAHLGRNADSTRILEMLKAISGEDAVNVNRKYLTPLMNIKLGVRFIITTNEMPHFVDPSGAYAARLLILPFNKSFEGHEDRTLDESLRTESPGILNWALGGLLMLREVSEFPVPKQSVELVDAARRLASPVSGFVDECCEQDPKVSTLCENIFLAWSEWTVKNGHEAGSAAKLGERLRAVNPAIARKRIREVDGSRPYVYSGITLNSSGGQLAAAAKSRLLRRW